MGRAQCGRPNPLGLASAVGPTTVEWCPQGISRGHGFLVAGPQDGRWVGPDALEERQRISGLCFNASAVATDRPPDALVPCAHAHL